MSDKKCEGRIKKLKALVERGVGGEKENALAILERLCETHGISLDEIDEDEVSWHEFKYSGSNYNKRLLYQCIYKTMGHSSEYKTYRVGSKNSKCVGIDCTVAQSIEIALDYEFYKDLFEKELDDIFSAFVNANNIFPPYVPVREGNVSEKVIQLLGCFEHHTRSGQLGEGE